MWLSTRAYNQYVTRQPLAVHERYHNASKSLVLNLDSRSRLLSRSLQVNFIDFRDSRDSCFRVCKIDWTELAPSSVESFCRV